MKVSNFQKHYNFLTRKQTDNLESTYCKVKKQTQEIYMYIKI